MNAFMNATGKEIGPKLLVRILVVALLVGLLPFNTQAAPADKAARKERQALRRMQQQLNEAQQQNSALDQEKAALEETLKKAGDEAESHKRSAASSSARASRLEKDIETVRREKAELQGQLEELRKQNQELSGQLKQLEQDMENTSTVLAREKEQKNLCETNNDELYRIGRELVDWYSHKGAWNAILEAEPFTRMKSVEMENILENYREKLEGQHLERSIN